MTKYISLILFLFLTSILFSQVSSVSLSKEEMKLYNLIMEYRAEYGLKKIPLSKSLTYVAKIHVWDLETNQPVGGKCNLHSWSTKGKWKSCCYTNDHKQAKCMWNKPRELTSYKGNGYEIASYYFPKVDAFKAFGLWKRNMGPNSVILNKDIWEDIEWNAIGIGISKKYAVVWFGKELDEEVWEE